MGRENPEGADGAGEEHCAQAWQTQGAPTVGILRVRILGDGVQVVGTVL